MSENVHSGGYFAATNTSADAGSIYQDIALSTSAGETVCGSEWVRSEVPSMGASGVFALFLLGSTAQDGGGANSATFPTATPGPRSTPASRPPARTPACASSSTPLRAVPPWRWTTSRSTVSCKGPRCPRPLTLRAHGAKRIHGLLKRLVGHRYHVGDVLTVTFTANGWTRERAKITIRDSRKPRVALA